MQTGSAQTDRKREGKQESDEVRVFMGIKAMPDAGFNYKQS